MGLSELDIGVTPEEEIDPCPTWTFGTDIFNNSSDSPFVDRMTRSCEVKNSVNYGFLLSWREKHLSLMSLFPGTCKAEKASAEGGVGQF
jgi:hypothetical protein